MKSKNVNGAFIAGEGKIFAVVIKCQAENLSSISTTTNFLKRLASGSVEYSNQCSLIDGEIRCDERKCQAD